MINSQNLTSKGHSMVKASSLKLKGLRRGELHPKADLSDHEVELVRMMHEGGMGYKKLAEKFDTPSSTIRDICKYLTR